MKIQKTFRILAAILAIAMISTFSFSVFADDVMLIAEPVAEEDIMLIEEATDAEVAVPETMPSAVTVMGSIAEIGAEEEIPNVLVNIDGDEANQILLHISEETALIKADGTPITLSDVAADSKIVAYHSIMVTRSLPAQSTAFVLVLLENEDDFYPIYMVATDKTEEGIASEDGNYIAAPAEECEVVPYKTRNIVTLDDVKAGSKILVWSRIMTMSIPALLNAEKIMILPEAVSGTPAVDGVIEFIPSEWAKEEVTKASEYGLLAGFDVINYQKNITRAEFAKLIMNCVAPTLGLSAEELAGDNGAQFTDIDDVSVNAAALLGIVKGVGEGKFQPEKEISRQEIAVMMHRAINAVSILLDKEYISAATDDLSAYTDAVSVADWAKAGVATLAANDIMKGTGEGVLSPLSETTVEQAILLATRIFDLMK